MTNQSIEQAEQFSKDITLVKREIGKVIVGQEQAVEGVLLSIFCNGHCLLVGVPGLAKTLLIQTLSQALDLSFNRIQFTPDLMPSDITGAEVLDENRRFTYIKGPIFANIVLADEINRTPPKTQAALLEAMQEKHVTSGGKTYLLPRPFFVLATQNPIEQEGTYPLPEAQLDRFMFNIQLTYPSFHEEMQIMRQTTSDQFMIPEKVLTAEKIEAYQQLVRQIPVADNVIEYVVKLVSSTRPDNEKCPQMVKDYISFGAGPRAGQFLVLGAKAYALFNGKLSPDIHDVQHIAKDVLRHRVVKNYKAEAEGITIEKLIEQLL
jgi:MoxR-like ATPase